MKWKQSLMNHSNWCLNVIYTNGQASTLGQRQGVILVKSWKSGNLRYFRALPIKSKKKRKIKFTVAAIL